MLFNENLTRIAVDAERAREDSLILWRELRWTNGRSRPEDLSLHENDADVLPVNLPGRYQLGDANEYPCEIVSVSPAGIRIKGPANGSVGKWSTVDIVSVGIAGGIVVNAQIGSFVLGVISPPRRLRRLAQRLHWHLQLQKGEVEERRSSERVEMNRARATLQTSEGRSFSCELFDISEGGAAVHLGSEALYLWAEQPVSLDGRAGQVLRHFPGGVVVRFD